MGKSLKPERIFSSVSHAWTGKFKSRYCFCFLILARQIGYGHIRNFLGFGRILFVKKSSLFGNGIRCSWVIIKHFPEQYLKENIDSLGYGRNYYFICRRLCLQKNYEVDKSQLTKLDYLSILALKHEQIEDNEVLDTMFALVHDLCVGGVSWQEGRTLSHGSIYSATSSSQISRALDYLYEMGCHSAAGLFRSWDDKVKQSIFESQEYIEINHTPMNDSTYQHKIVGLGMLYMYEALEDKYKSKDDPSADQIKSPFPYYYVIETNENPDELPF